MTAPAPAQRPAIKRLQVAISALTVAVAGAVAGAKIGGDAPLAIPPAVPYPDQSCRFNAPDSLLLVQGGDHVNAFLRADTLYYVPPRGSAERLRVAPTDSLKPGDSTQYTAVCIPHGVKLVPFAPSPQNETPSLGTSPTTAQKVS